MIDLEFDRIGEAESFLSKLQRLWDGRAKAVTQNPRARIATAWKSRSSERTGGRRQLPRCGL